jgi:hypothetical protein
VVAQRGGGGHRKHGAGQASSSWLTIEIKVMLNARFIAEPGPILSELFGIRAS